MRNYAITITMIRRAENVTAARKIGADYLVNNDAEDLAVAILVMESAFNAIEGPTLIIPGEETRAGAESAFEQAGLASGWDQKDGFVFDAKLFAYLEEAQESPDAVIYNNWTEWAAGENIELVSLSDVAMSDVADSIVNAPERPYRQLKIRAQDGSVGKSGVAESIVTALPSRLDTLPVATHSEIRGPGPFTASIQGGEEVVIIAAESDVLDKPPTIPAEPRAAFTGAMEKALGEIFADIPDWRKQFHPLASSKGKRALEDLVSLVSSIRAELKRDASSNVTN